MNELSEQKTEISPEKRKVIRALIISCGFVLILYIIRIVESTFNLNFTELGILPREVSGLKGILLAPLIHADYLHLFSNSLPLLVSVFFIVYAYPKSAIYVFIITYIFSGAGVWFLGREAYHIGASGLIFGFIAFLFCMGVLRKEKKSIGIALIIVFLYGGTLCGILPTDPSVSFESHLFGFTTGVICSLIFKNRDEYTEKYDWENEDDDNDDEENEDDNDDDENNFYDNNYKDL